MKFDHAASRNPIDQLKVVGKPVDRIDGPLKTTGTAKYAYEHHDERLANVAYGYPLVSGVAKGRIASIDTAKARRAPGVLAIVTAKDAPPLGKGHFNTARLLGGPEIEHYHQAIGVVVAESFEEARAAAHLVAVTYDAAPGHFDLTASRDSEHGQTVSPHHVGDFDSAFSKAAVTFDQTYTTPYQSHAMMEPHASTAMWHGEKLSIWISNQMVAWTRKDLATTLGIPKENIRLMAPYIGGGFGGKLWLRSDAVLAALGAKAAGRPVKIMLPRPIVFNNTTHRSATVQRIRLGAAQDGRLQAICHESWSGNLPGGKPETAVAQTRLLYAGTNRRTALHLADLDLPEANSMRAPGEAPGLMALEVAMDELAEKLGMDPVDLRVVNDTQVDPSDPSRPFSSRHLVKCLRLGADRFGWKRRIAKPGQMREGRWLIGMGVASAFRNNLLKKSGARVRLDHRGIVTVETDMTDIGTGSYTIIAQTAAEMMGVPLEHVVVKLGDSDYPQSCGSGGQWGANNSTAGVYAACQKLREMVAAKLGINPDKAAFVNGQVGQGARQIPLGRAAAHEEIVAEDSIDYADVDKKYQQSTFGAHFAEVAVDSVTGEIRLRKMLAVCAAGRILNPKTARSQVIGAMTMGVGAALMEELAVDTRRGFFVNHDLAGYEVPVHADIPHQDVVFLDEVDPYSSPMKAKGVGELGLCGVGAAISNAVYNATGARIRSYPVTLDKLLDHLPKLA